jgi:CRP-like cAMP-binding protein
LLRAQNYLIQKMSRAGRTLFLAGCEPVELKLGQILCQRGDVMRHDYFPVDSFVSLLTNTDGHSGLEVSMVGREGMVGAHLALGVSRTPLQALVQVAGAAWRVDATAFRRTLLTNDLLRRAIDRYIYVLMAQLASSAACLRFHLIKPRLARWLLMSQDRSQASTFTVTHEFLAYMLGVRRVGITAAAGDMQRDGLIEYSRGKVTVLNRKGLEKAACGCYAADQKAYADLL